MSVRTRPPTELAETIAERLAELSLFSRRKLQTRLAHANPASVRPSKLSDITDSAPNTSRASQSQMAAQIEKDVANGITFAAQDKLPKLPIPDLSRTCERYLATLKPLQSHKEHVETQHAVNEFLRHQGPELQEKLKSYAQDKTSYIEQFWYDSYLNYDNPVVLNLNPFFLLEDDPTPARNNQVTRAASLVVSALEFIRAVRKEELPPDTVRGTPLCMYQYSRLFGTARVPTDAGCHIQQDPAAKHLVVMCHGQLYWFDVLDDNSDVIMTERDITINLRTIIDDAVQTPIQEAAKGALGVLTTENRKVWSGLRDILRRDPGSNNADSLDIVDSALFVLCLDYTEAPNVAALCQNMLCGTSEIERGVQIGTCTNRWYDKLQIIVCKNGSAGINFEHTGVDGHTVLRFASDVYTDTILRFARSINGQAPSLWKSISPDPSKRDPSSFGSVSITPRKLEWDVLPELSVAVRFAETRLADLIQQNEFQCLNFGSYGKNFITSMGFSPDAFVQMAFQAAYYGMYGRVECTYEPAMTKFYLHGRTEAVRSVTEESVNFVQTFWGDNPAELKVEALRQACKKHTGITRDCAKAEGCDRHLYALYCVWQKYIGGSGLSSGLSSPAYTDSNDIHSDVGTPPVTNGGSPDIAVVTSPVDRSISPGLQSHDGHHLPLIFSDHGWDRLNTTILSTSNCGNPSLRYFGFGPASGDGFGIGYIIKDNSIAICTASKHRQTKRFLDTLESYLMEIRRALRLGARKAADQNASRAREVERPKTISRVKSAGRPITVTDGAKSLSNSENPSQIDDGPVDEDDDGLGGYGFFDAGMLMKAIKGRVSASNDDAESKATTAQPDEKTKRNSIGKKLHLSEY